MHSDIDKVESLNNYFASISCLVGDEPALPEFSLLCTDVLDKMDIFEQDISDVISTLQVNKAIGPDDISHKTLKETIHSVSIPLCLLFNRCISQTMEECKCTSVI